MNDKAFLSQCVLNISLSGLLFVSFAAISTSFDTKQSADKNKQLSQQAILINESMLYKGALTNAKLNRPVITSETHQLVVVVIENEQDITGDLLTFERTLDQKSKTQFWSRNEVSTQVVVGKNGIAWGKGLHPKQQGIHKKEGDGKAPSGVFALGTAFGYLPNVDTQLAYTQMSADDYCIDVNGSPYYNQIVSKAIVGVDGIKDSSEPMRRDLHLQDHLYKKGIVIAHNAENISGEGSCIFMHVWRDSHKPTAGCTAMSEAALDQLLQWLDKNKQPAFVLLTKAQYLEFQQRWLLPEINFSVPTQ